MSQKLSNCSLVNHTCMTNKSVNIKAIKLSVRPCPTIPVSDWTCCLTTFRSLYLSLPTHIYCLYTAFCAPCTIVWVCVIPNMLCSVCADYGIYAVICAEHLSLRYLLVVCCAPVVTCLWADVFVAYMPGRCCCL